MAEAGLETRQAGSSPCWSSVHITMITQEVKQNRDTPPLPATRGEPCPVIFAVSSPISLHAFAPPTGSWAWFLLPLHLGALGLPAPWWKWCWDCSVPRLLGAGQFSPYPHGVKLPYCKEDLARLLMLRCPPAKKKRGPSRVLPWVPALSDSTWLQMTLNGAEESITQEGSATLPNHEKKTTVHFKPKSFGVVCCVTNR